MFCYFGSCEDLFIAHEKLNCWHYWDWRRKLAN